MSRPKPGTDYPRTFDEMDRRFRDAAACREYMQGVRWPDGFTCAKCGVADDPWMMSRGRLRCRACGWETSLTAGTIFQDTRKPLRAWFLAMWFVTSQKNGVSALDLQRELGLGSYETAWTWLHKLRRAMVRPGRDHLGGEIEIDETYVGGRDAGNRGRGAGKKVIVAVAAEKSGRGIGRIRRRPLTDVSGESLVAFVQGSAGPGAMIHTDGWRGYSGLAALGYRHKVTPITGGAEPAHEVMPRVHLAAQAMADRHASGRHPAAAARLLPRRIHAITRKSFGEMTGKLSVTESRNPAQSSGTVLRRKPGSAPANCAHRE